MNTPVRRVALCGFFLECNRWSPVTTAADFAATCDLAGEALREEWRRQPPRLLGDTVGFVAAMDTLGPGRRCRCVWLPPGPADPRNRTGSMHWWPTSGSACARPGPWTVYSSLRMARP